MTIEERIRKSAARTVRVRITGRRRSATGFTVNVKGHRQHFPNRTQALSFLLAVVRVAPVQVFDLAPARKEDA